MKHLFGIAKTSANTPDFNKIINFKNVLSELFPDLDITTDVNSLERFNEVGEVNFFASSVTDDFIKSFHKMIFNFHNIYGQIIMY